MAIASKAAALALLLTLTVGSWGKAPHRRHRPTRYYCRATAYSIEGLTKRGTEAHFGVVAGDPRVFPIGTRIRVSRAGAYSGEYMVTDTGAKVLGQHIDIYLPDDAEAKKFGRKRVLVHVLEWGHEQQPAPPETPSTK